MPPDGLTYPEVGATRHDPLPLGYNHLRVRTKLGESALADRAAQALVTWRLHNAAGMRVAAPPVRLGLRVRGRLGGIDIPCEVVWATPKGFAYGTLPGHPECGEEAFVVEVRDGFAWFEVTAFSRPAVWYTRLLGPVVITLQHAYAKWLGVTLRRIAARR